MSPAARSIAALGVLALIVAVAPVLAPHDPSRQFSRYPFAPPMRVHLFDDGWRPHAPFVYGLRLIDPLERRYEQDRSQRLPIRDDAPAFLLGSDGFGRDVLSRTLAGARLSLALAFAATALALALAALVGGIAGYAGGRVDGMLMRIAEFVLVLPALYVALALRGTLPLVLSTRQVFATLALVFGAIGWPAAARGVRGIITVERSRQYAEAAYAIGASPWRVISRHLLPSAFGFLVVQATVLVPAFVMAEAALSLVGFGFAPPASSWGTMIEDLGSGAVAADAPWLLAPVAGMALTIFFLQAFAGSKRSTDPITRS
jgi:peptide/nickel transport system permease protein